MIKRSIHRRKIRQNSTPDNVRLKKKLETIPGLIKVKSETDRVLIRKNSAGFQTIFIKNHRKSYWPGSQKKYQKKTPDLTQANSKMVASLIQKK